MKIVWKKGTNIDNTALNEAKKKKNNEWFTRYEDIEKEIPTYKEHLKDKVIYCNADDYRQSNFVKYFKDHFDEYQLKGLMATNINNGEGAYWYYYNGEEEAIEKINNGDFRKCIKYLKIADVVITNPPFSLLSEYMEMLLKYNKHFLIIGSVNALSYCSIVQQVLNGEIHLGKNTPREFIDPKRKYGRTKHFGFAVWVTNLNVNNKRGYKFTAKYSPEKYPCFDDCPEIINVPMSKDVPIDYNGLMAVPISFLEYIDTDLFELVGFKNHFVLNGHRTYKRWIIKRKK